MLKNVHTKPKNTLKQIIYLYLKCKKLLKLGHKKVEGLAYLDSVPSVLKADCSLTPYIVEHLVDHIDAHTCSL